MFGRWRRNNQTPVEVALAAAGTAANVDPSILARLGSRSSDATPQHKSLLARSLIRRPATTNPLLAAAPRAGGEPVITPASAQTRLASDLSLQLTLAPLTIEDIAAIFERRAWHYEVVEGHLVSAFDGVLMVLGVEPTQRMVRVLVPLAPGKGVEGYVAPRADAELSAAIYMLSANYGLPLGAFTRDHRDGEIRFESAILLPEGVPGDEQIERAILIAVTAVLHHGPAIAKLLTGRMALKQALTKLEEERTIPRTMTA